MPACLGALLVAPVRGVSAPESVEWMEQERRTALAPMLRRA
eukprot:CAMPEP_0180306658 /NCGR_PEP_ID=MMETSP0988-20121125/27212_1 /TAXON_ID=697907 /ORGANISM="non described non described, Strain CCMP2293" /LENGTH=40 /DNA_ID= /DNA_START= /DNA_END= /DNA_ORIENTATION=